MLCFKTEYNLVFFHQEKTEFVQMNDNTKADRIK